MRVENRPRKQLPSTRKLILYFPTTANASFREISRDVGV